MSYIKPNDYFGKILCVNLDRRTDRWTECEKEFKRHALVVERFPAVDGKTLPQAGRLTPGENGCRASHLAALRVAAAQTKPTLILEDDVEFADHFVNYFSLHIAQLPSWILLYLGGNHVHRPTKVPSNPVIMRVIRTFTTSSYAVTPQSAAHLIPIVEANPNLQIDIIYAQVQPKTPCYTFYPSLAWQKPGYSDIQEGDVNYKQYMKK